MDETQPESSFVQKRLPWIISAVALVVFLFTLNQWINTRSLPIVAKVLGWDWTPPLGLPLFYLLTLPFKILPQPIAPIALNAFTAICAALTLGLLARSVALLPHDRTHEQRIRERNENSLLSIRLNWVPVLLAVCVAGFQLTFWEHATSATNEMLDLLIFAYCIRNLLEYRIDQREGWLIRMAFVYGLGVTNNWAMIGFFPLFLVALIWIKGRSFMDATAIARLTIAGLLGLLLYFYLPALWSATNETAKFGEVLKAILVQQKTYLTASSLRQPALVLALTSILPVLLMGIRWPGGFGETSEIGARLASVMFRFVHLFFLGACLWVTFDQAFSPRRIGLGLPFLTFYYLGALAIGYYSGYALLTFTPLPKRIHLPDAAIMKLLNPLIRALVLLAALLVPVALAVKNLPAAKVSDGRLMKEFAAMTVEQLPKPPAYLFSDDVFQTVLIRGYLARDGRADDFIFVDTRGMEVPSYHEDMVARYGSKWPKISSRAFTKEERTLTLSKQLIQGFVGDLVASNQVAYLHPSFGYYFEKAYTLPKGVIYPLTSFAPEQIIPPPLSPELLTENSAFWKRFDSFNQRLAAASKLNSADAQFLAVLSSRALNTWGTVLQRSERHKEAEPIYSLAATINSNNLPAGLNLEFSRNLAAGRELPASTIETYEGRMVAVGNWNDVLRSHGPFEEPYFAFRLANLLLNEQLYRQGLQLIDRVIHYQPTNYLANSVYIRGLVYGGWPGQGVKHIQALRGKMPELTQTNKIELINLESVAYFAMQDTNKAGQILAAGLAEFPQSSVLQAAQIDYYRSTGDFTNALATLEGHIKTTRTNSMFKLQKSEVLVAMGRYDDALATIDEVLRVESTFLPAIIYKAYVALTAKKLSVAREAVDRALRLDPENEQALIYMSSIQIEEKEFDKAVSALNLILDRDEDHPLALRNRAIAYLKDNKLDEAEADFKHLQELNPVSHVPYFGLGELAFKRKKNDEARKNYQLYLQYLEQSGVLMNPELVAERDEIKKRLEQLK